MKNIPIKAAKKFALEQGLDQVIVLGWSKAKRRTYVVTYGKTVKDCLEAAMGGNAIKRQWGWPEELCNVIPPRAKKRVAKMKEFANG